MKSSALLSLLRSPSPRRAWRTATGRIRTTPATTASPTRAVWPTSGPPRGLARSGRAIWGRASPASSSPRAGSSRSIKLRPGSFSSVSTRPPATRSGRRGTHAPGNIMGRIQDPMRRRPGRTGASASRRRRAWSVAFAPRTGSSCGRSTSTNASLRAAATSAMRRAPSWRRAASTCPWEASVAA